MEEGFELAHEILEWLVDLACQLLLLLLQVDLV